MKNRDVKTYAKSKKVKLWQIADKLGLLDSNFSRKLRKELSVNEKEHIFAIINNLKIETDEVSV